MISGGRFGAVVHSENRVERARLAPSAIPFLMFRVNEKATPDLRPVPPNVNTSS